MSARKYSSATTLLTASRIGHARHLAHQRQHMLQLRHAVEFDGEGHARRAAARKRLGRRHIDFLARQDFRDVAQQALPVLGIDDEIHRIQCRTRAATQAPVCRNDPLRILRGDALEMAASALLCNKKS